MKSFRAFLFLAVIAVVIWFAGRAIVHRGDLKATIVFRDSRGIRAGAPVISNRVEVGRVTKVQDRGERKAVNVRIDRGHPRVLLRDSLFAIENDAVVVTNTFAVGAPVENGALLEAKEDRVSRWLARHGKSVESYVEKARVEADRFLDEDFARWTASVPDWKKKGRVELDRHVGEARAHVAKAAADLREKSRYEEARQLTERFENWVKEVYD